MNKKIDGLLTLYVDVDDTLIMHDISEYETKDIVSIHTPRGEYKCIPNRKNINTIVKFYKLGYTIIVWSKTGSDWAEIMGKALDIDQYVSVYLSKPMFYLDDKDVLDWIGPRIWRDASGQRHKEKLVREKRE